MTVECELCSRQVSGSPFSTGRLFSARPAEEWAATGLDYFGARYFSGAQGRFTNPDPISATLLHVINPQRWDMYAYGLNNPLAYTDPDGRAAIAVKFGNLANGLGHRGIGSVRRDGTGKFADFGHVHPGTAHDAGRYTFQDVKLTMGANGQVWPCW